MGSSCFQRGNKSNLEFIEAYLQEHKCTANIELVGSRCEDECRKGPNLVINGRSYHGVTREILADLMEQLIGKKPGELMPEAPEESLVFGHQQGNGFRK
jgi:NADH:ubiquinone oxidoreductase subunit E